MSDSLNVHLAEMEIHAAMESLIKAFIEVVFLNVNTDRRLKNKLYQQFVGQYGMDKRVELLKKLIKDGLELGKIMCLFEIDSEMYDMLKTYHTNIMTFQYNKSASAFRYMIFIPDGKSVKESYHIPFTTNKQFIEDCDIPPTDKDKRENKDYMKLTYGELFHKSAVHLIFEDGTGKLFNLIITHIGLSMQTRMHQMRELEQYANSLDTNMPIIIGGDFNAFTVEGGIYLEHMKIMEDGGYKALVPYDRNTFDQYGYDIMFKLSDANKIVYQEFIKKSNDPTIDIEKLSIEFKTFCDTVPLLSTPPTALDNIFIKNCTSINVEVIDKCCNSDHSAILLEFTI